MMAALACAALLSLDPAPSAEDLKTYEAAAAIVGRSAEAHVRLAVWCEARGMENERAKHLRMAVIFDPSNATARGLLGMVRDGEGWKKLGVVTERYATLAKSDASLAEYAEKRSKAANTADPQWKLAQWCEQKGLRAEGTAHAIATTRLDPNHILAWRYLGYKDHNGRWMTDDQVAADRAESKKQEEATRKWKPLLSKWRDGLKNPHLKADSERNLAGVTDPRAVPVILKVFGTSQPSDQKLALQLLGQIDGQKASRALLLFAYQGKTAEIRRLATQTLKQRDPREFLGLVIAQIHDIVKYEVRPVGGIGSPGVLFVEGKKYNVRRIYTPPPPSALAIDQTEEIFRQRQTNFFIPIDGYEQTITSVAFSSASGGPFSKSAILARLQLSMRRDRMVATNQDEMVHSVQSERMQLAEDVAAIDRGNEEARYLNECSRTILSGFTSEDFGTDQEGWSRWWTDQEGYATAPDVSSTTPKPTFDDEVPPDYVPSYSALHHSCFAAGTSVTTRQGPRPIETLQVGDLVLTQDPATGRLSFEPVVGVFHNRPAATLRLHLENSDVVATGIHRFWKVGQGWVMAREIKPADRLRTARGIVRVESVSPEKIQKVYNLEVASGHSFFVGDVGALVHDNSLVQPVTEPFDAPPSLASSK